MIIPSRLVRPLRDRLDSFRTRARSSSGSYDGRWFAQRNQFREIMAELREDDDAAPEQVLAVLSPDQKQIARDILDEEREKAEGNGPPCRRGDEFGRGRHGGY